jgi:hypothetical protein
MTTLGDTESLINEVTPVFCVNCKHIKGNRFRLSQTAYPEIDAECFKTEKSGDWNLVTGVRFKTFETCKSLRTDETKCGLEGKWFELYVKPEYLIPVDQPALEESVESSARPVRVSIKNVGADDL